MHGTITIEVIISLMLAVPYPARPIGSGNLKRLHLLKIRNFLRVVSLCFKLYRKQAEILAI